MSASPETKSPIRAKPLRQPGQSCDERKQQVFERKLEVPFLIAGVSIALAAIEVFRYYWNAPPSPRLYISFALVAVVFAALRWRKYRPEIRNLSLAAEGERAVGQFLDRLRSEGYEVFHDVPANGFNVDHVIVGPVGVFSIETKTWKKPKRGKAEVSFNGEVLLRNGMSVDRDPITQAKAQSSWLANQIEAGTGRRVRVKPVVLIPGWWIESSEGAHREVWVLEPKAFPKFLGAQPHRLEIGEMHQIAYHLSRYVRTFVPEA
jgi:hypothetical protein